jgi:glycosyltransferase involved in cell wall biosynthesis
MKRLVFLTAVYNEQEEIVDLLQSVMGGVEAVVISDDGSTDSTIDLVDDWASHTGFSPYKIIIINNDHIGLAETIKSRGVSAIKEYMSPYQWVLMLDADERLGEGVLNEIVRFIDSPASEGITHVWFGLHEYIDGQGPLRSFLKCRLFRAYAAHFSESVHEDDRFDGQGANLNWPIIHRKTSEKQKMRERQYLKTYKKLLAEGKVTQEWVDRCIGFHYFIKEDDDGEV